MTLRSVVINILQKSTIRIVIFYQMKSFKEVYAASKAQMLEAKKTQIDRDKVALLEGIKRDQCITCKLKELPKQRQDQVLNMLLEFWSPKKGINKAGQAFLESGKLAINENSSVANIKLFAEREVKDNINEFARAFVNNRGKEIVERLQNNIQVRCKRRIKYQPLFEMAFKIVSEKIQNDNM